MVLSLTNTRSRATTFRQLKHGTDCKFVFFMCRYDLVTERLVTFPACDMFEVDGWRKESSKILWSDFFPALSYHQDKELTDIEIG